MSDLSVIHKEALQDGICAVPGKPVSVGLDAKCTPCIWFVPGEPHMVTVLGTGWTYDARVAGEYVGMFVLEADGLVFHVFANHADNVTEPPS